MMFDVMAGEEMSGLCVSLHTQNVLVPTYNDRKGQRGKVSLVQVPMHVDQSTKRIELSLNTRCAWAGGTFFPVVLLCQFWVSGRK